jgi:hypothetical protein
MKMLPIGPGMHTPKADIMVDNRWHHTNLGGNLNIKMMVSQLATSIHFRFFGADIRTCLMHFKEL